MLNSHPSAEDATANEYRDPSPGAYEMDVQTFLRNIRRSWLFIVVFAALVCAALTAFYIAAPRKFATTSVLKYDASSESQTGTALQFPAGAAALFGGQSAQSDVQAFFYRMLLPSFLNEVVTSDAMAQQILADKKNAQTGAWNEPFEIAPPTRTDGVAALQEPRAIAYRVDPDTQLITLTTRAGSAEGAKEVNDRLIRTANAVFRREKQGETTRLISAYERQLASTQLVGIQDSLRRMLERSIEQRMLIATRSEYPLRVLEPAPLPESPDRPKKMLLALIAIAMTIVFALLCGLFRRPSRR